MKEKHVVEILGTRMTLLSDESEEYVKSLVSVLDRRISNMVMTNLRCTKLDAVVMCALDYLDEKLKADAEIESLKAKLHESEEKIGELKKKIDDSERKK